VNDTPRLAPDLGGTISGALQDTWPAFKSWIPWLIGVVIVCCAGGYLVFQSGFYQSIATKEPGSIAHPEYYGGGIGLIDLGFAVGACFALASAVRAIQPDFRFTVGKFFGFLGYSILVGIIMVLGFICLVIPGFYLFVKLGAAPYYYLFGEGEPMKKAWETTKERFWWTVLAYFLIALCTQVGMYALMIVGAIAYFIPFALVVVAPILVAGLFAVYQFQYNAYVRWFDNLLKTA
jgi:hypothetical protein